MNCGEPRFKIESNNAYRKQLLLFVFAYEIDFYLANEYNLIRIWQREKKGTENASNTR